MGNAVIWVEIPVKDFDRAKRFYEQVLKARIDLVPTPRGRWGMLPYEMGEPHGGCAIVEGEKYEPAAGGSVVYLNGGIDLSQPLSRVEKAGGKIMMGKTPNGGFGFIALFTDSEGNKIGFHSPE
jgi:predicted enzyme related to lactoylglutathione lyase